MVEPLPPEYPPTWASLLEAVHANVVPATGPVKPTFEDSPEQMVDMDGLMFTVGIGCTVTVAVVELPGQPLAEELMV